MSHKTDIPEKLHWELTDYETNTTEKNATWKAKKTRKLILWNPNVHCRVHEETATSPYPEPK
jgi:hypothetical protein